MWRVERSMLQNMCSSSVANVLHVRHDGREPVLLTEGVMVVCEEDQFLVERVRHGGEGQNLPT